MFVLTLPVLLEALVFVACPFFEGLPGLSVASLSPLLFFASDCSLLGSSCYETISCSITNLT